MIFLMHTKRFHYRNAVLIALFFLFLCAITGACVSSDIPAVSEGSDFNNSSDAISIEEIKDLLPIKIGYSSYPYPPLHYFEDNSLGDLQAIGFDIELAETVARTINAEIEFLQIDWSKKAEMLISGEVDMLWGGLAVDSLDETKVKFTKPYLQSNIVLVMDAEDDYSSLEDLHDLNICSLEFTPAADFFNFYDASIINSRQAFITPIYKQLFTAVSLGKYDCIITDVSFASFLCRITQHDYKISETIIESSYAVAVRVEDEELFAKLQAALDELDANGTISRIAEKWIF
ncbi:MAG: transporter substrate-binding domain-containing protein [Firmicutes bacterium]|nr:transporter substrate-binding domain-containing protein [Bacillota bacterium]